MKKSGILLLASISVMAQAADKAKVINFDRADREHCGIVMIEGRPMLRTVYGGTSVAVGLPVSTAEGDFRVFVVIGHPGPGKARVKPREFTALYSDAAHTRFSFYDKAVRVNRGQVSEEREEPAGVETASSQGDPRLLGMPSTPDATGNIDRQARARRKKNQDLNGPTREQEDAREAKQNSTLPGVSVTAGELYLRQSTLRQGRYAEGFVYFRMPQGAKLHVGPRDLLFQIDIPVNGVVFRFS
jgi:hypothetical protein